MSRSLRGFLAFCAIAVVAVVVATWWIGPRTLVLAFSDEQPLHLLHFARFAEDDAPSYASGYLEGLRAVVATEAGAELWHGTLVPVARGRLRDEWQDVAVFRFGTAGEFVRAATGSEFRSLSVPGQRFERLVVTTDTGPQAPLDGLGALVFMLLESDADLPYTGTGLDANLGLYHGHVVWQAPVTVLELGVPARWNQLVVLGFELASDAEAWLGDTEAMTERAIAAARHRGLATVLVQAAEH